MATFATRNTTVTNPDAHPDAGPTTLILQDGNVIWAHFARRTPGLPYGVFETTDPDTIERLRALVNRGDLGGHRIIEITDDTNN